jgi:hypothetical protein
MVWSVQSTVLKHNMNELLFRYRFDTRLQAPEDVDGTCPRNVVHYRVIQNEKSIYWKMIISVIVGGGGGMDKDCV